MNAALDMLVDQQRGWRVPDHALRANLHDAIVEDFVTAYRVRPMLSSATQAPADTAEPAF